MLRVLNLSAAILFAVWGTFNLVLRFFADHPSGYSMELLNVDLTVAFSYIAAIGFLLLMKQIKFGLTLVLVASAGLLILSPFTEQVMFVPVYVVLDIIAWLIFRQIGKPAAPKK